MAIRKLSSQKEPRRRPWKDQVFNFMRNEEEGTICLSAWTLGKVSDADLQTYEINRAVRLKVRNFTIRNPVRDIRHFEYHMIHDGEKPSAIGTGMPQPPVNPAGLRPTRLDFDIRPQLPGAGRQRFRVKVVLSEGLEFFQGIEITAKTKASAQRLVNLKITTEDSKHMARFWVLSENGSGQDVEHGFNIAVVALDTDEASGLSLPVIIDPSIRIRD